MYSDYELTSYIYQLLKSRFWKTRAIRVRRCYGLVKWVLGLFENFLFPFWGSNCMVYSLSRGNIEHFWKNPKNPKNPPETVWKNPKNPTGFFGFYPGWVFRDCQPCSLDTQGLYPMHLIRVCVIVSWECQWYWMFFPRLNDFPKFPGISGQEKKFQLLLSLLISSRLLTSEGICV